VKFALLDVGHGNSGVVHHGKRAIIIDCPPGLTLPKYLHDAGVETVEDLIISHAHKDHCGGVPGLVKAGFRIDRIWLNDDHLNGGLPYLRLKRVFEEQRMAHRKIERRWPHSDQKPIDVGKKLRVEFLAPHHEDRLEKQDTNRMSVVVRISYDKQGLALLPGDLDLRGFQLSYDGTRDYSAHWLVAPHHGGRTSPSKDSSGLLRRLLELTQAKELFFSFARNSPHELPRPEVLKVAKGAKVGIRCAQLAKACHASDTGELPKSFRNDLSAGFDGGEANCCAGTVVIDLADGPAWSLGPKHQKFIADNITGAQCAMGELFIEGPS
jgi:competence protein ComEC